MAKVLIIGSGGREEALKWSIAQDPNVEMVGVAPGNAGTSLDDKCVNVPIDGANKKNFGELFDYVEKENIDVVVVGPEQPLVDGIVNQANARGLNNFFGPTAAGAQLEADKFFSHDLMRAIGIPHAESIQCYSLEEAEAAIKYLSTNEGVVIKARGLTGGKGVYVCDSLEEALSKLPEHLKSFKSNDVLISERLFGQEFSVFGISDGERVVPLEISVQDHKQLFDGDLGPMTGGMGAYGPAPIADAEMVRRVSDEMMTPLVQGMKKRGTEYKGFVYAAVIMTKIGPKILEYNVRFGDPEAQPAVMMLKNGLYQPIKYALDGKLDEINVEFKPGAACCVVMAAKGYSSDKKLMESVQGRFIHGLKEAAQIPGVKVFHAGTEKKDGGVVTKGGRNVGVTAYSAEGISDACKNAYDGVFQIDLHTPTLRENSIFHYRQDIAAKALGEK